MTTLQAFWTQVADDIESVYKNGHPSNWKKGTIEVFRGHFEEKIKRLCRNDSNKAQLCGIDSTIKGKILIDKFEAPSYFTFRNVFKKKTSQGNESTRHQFAIYLGFESYQDYIGKKRISVHKNPSFKLTDLMSWRFKINDYYSSKSSFNYIPIVQTKVDAPYQLEMSHFFIDLSYIKREEISKEDALMLSEKESYHEKYFRRIFHHNALSHGFITQEILSNYSRLVILGNPGIGKSTFARWICWKWTKEFSELPSFIPLYFNLRELKYRVENSIIDYLVHHFFKGEETDGESLQMFLSSNVDHFIFLLDGFDELQDSSKTKLWSDLETLAPKAKYVVFSRPYGLIDQSFTYDLTFEIIGFNESTRKRYIENIVAIGKEEEHLVKDLEKTIEDIPTLKDFSYNPLMLSYITTLFLHSVQARKKLALIESIYDLQDQLVGWLKNYYSTKKIEESFDQMLTKSQLFAYEMEMKNLFLYESSYALDPHSNTAYSLSRLGLGSKEELELTKWRFHFNTITFQEFLGARYIADRITASAILYALEDKMKWNFCKMIIGYLSSNQKGKVIEEVLLGLENSFEKTGHIYYRHLYFIIVSELDKVQFQKIVDQDLLLKVLKHFADLPDNSEWDILIAEAISRCFLKLSLPQQHQFGLQILTRIEEILFEEILFEVIQRGHQRINERIQVYTDNLILKLKLNQKVFFVKAFLEIYLKLLKKIEQLVEKREYAKEEEIDFLDQRILDLDNRALGFSYILNKTNPDFLVKHFPELMKEVVFLFPGGHTKELTQLNGLVYSLEEIKEKVEEQEVRVIAGKDHVDYKDLDEEDLAKYLAYDVSSLAATLSIFAYAYGKIYGVKKTEYFQFIKRIWNLILKKTEEDYLINDPNYFEQSLHWLVYSLNCLNELSFAEPIKLIYLYGLNSDLEIKDSNLFQQYVQLMLDDLKTNFTTSGFDELVYAFKCTTEGKKLFFYNRVEVWDLFVKYVEKEESSLLEMNGEEVPDTIYLSKEPSLVVLENLKEILSFDYDKKFFVDSLISSSLTAIPYIRIRFLLELLQNDFIFYEQKYWDYLFELAENGLTFRLFGFLNFSKIYVFKKNLPQLEKLWELLNRNLQDQSVDLIKENISFIYRSAFYTLFYLKKVRKSDEFPQLIQTVTLLFAKDYFKAELFNVQSWGLKNEFLIYPMLSLLSGNLDLLAPTEIEQVLEARGMSFDAYAARVIQVFEKEEEIVFLRSVLGHTLAEVSIAFLHKHEAVSANFERVKFEEQLKMLPG